MTLTEPSTLLTDYVLGVLAAIDQHGLERSTLRPEVPSCIKPAMPASPKQRTLVVTAVNDGFPPKFQFPAPCLSVR